MTGAQLALREMGDAIRNPTAKCPSVRPNLEADVLRRRVDVKFTAPRQTPQIPDAIQHGEQRRRKDPDDGDDHQQFNERETPADQRRWR